MDDPIMSLRVWSYYVLGVGAALLVIPNLVFDVLAIAHADEVWVRVLGLVAVVLGINFNRAARGRHLDMVAASVTARVVAIAGFVALWLTGGPWQLVLFAMLDLLGAAWSWTALRSNERRQPAHA